MERKEATALGLTKYNTGRACRHGHQADRYVASGACADCLAAMRHPTGKRERPPEIELAQRKAIFDKVLAETVEIYLYAHFDDITEVMGVAAALCALRFPEAISPMFKPSRSRKTSIGDGMYRITVRVPREDAQATYAIGQAYWDKRKTRFIAGR